VRAFQVVKVNSEEVHLFTVTDPVVVGDFGEVVVFKVIYQHGKSLFDMLGDDMPDHVIRFSGSWVTQDQNRSKGVDDINPAFFDAILQSKLEGKIDRVLVLQKFTLLGKGLVPAVEDILIGQIMGNHSGKYTHSFNQTEEPQRTDQDIAQKAIAKARNLYKDQVTPKIQTQTQSQIEDGLFCVEFFIPLSFVSKHREDEKSQGEEFAGVKR